MRNPTFDEIVGIAQYIIECKARNIERTLAKLPVGKKMRQDIEKYVSNYQNYVSHINDFMRRIAILYETKFDVFKSRLDTETLIKKYLESELAFPESPPLVRMEGGFEEGSGT